MVEALIPSPPGGSGREMPVSQGKCMNVVVTVSILLYIVVDPKHLLVCRANLKLELRLNYFIHISFYVYK